LAADWPLACGRRFATTATAVLARQVISTRSGSSLLFWRSSRALTHSGIGTGGAASWTGKVKRDRALAMPAVSRQAWTVR